jgi:Icc-related predicted phosphoesterase
MKLQIFSDLHLEFAPFELTHEQADVLIFAGDIHIGVQGITWLKSLNIAKPILYVLGNHEYYKQIYPKLLRQMQALVQGTTIQILENSQFILGDICFHGATLWTDYNLFGVPRVAGYEAQQMMNDFRKIRREPNYSKLRAIDVAAIHAQSLKWLNTSLVASKASKNVVISHHAPSVQSLPESQKEKLLSAAYASNLEDFINSFQPDLWIHGHVHNSCDYRVGNCRVITNPRGYINEFNSAFNAEYIIEL